MLLVEPHFDDAALSCAALLARESRLELLTVFAGEPDQPRRGYWDEICGFADSREGLAIRSAEAAAAFAGSHHRLSFLPLLEGQYIEARSPADAELLAAEVQSWARRSPGGFVALPAGAGRRWRLARGERIPPHEEHLFVRDAALAARDDSWSPILYEEFPYALGGRADREVARIARRSGLAASLIELAVDRVDKARRIAAYASQVSLISPPGLPLNDPAALPALERYWLLER
jgi:hypothetical protein